MPALRKCLAIVFPSCFSSSAQNSQYNNYSDTPNRLSSNTRLKTRSGLGTALQSFGGITKTVDTNFSVTRVEDDEQELVDGRRGGVGVQHQWGGARSSAGSEAERRSSRLM